MSTIKGIFEPFASYVTHQLNLRKTIISNKQNQFNGENIVKSEKYTPAGSEGLDVIQGSGAVTIDTQNSFDGGLLLDSVDLNEPSAKLPPKISDFLGTRHEHFYTYTTEKQCTIRMASGVDVREKNNILEDFEEHLTGANLSRQYILEGGTKTTPFFNRGGISEGPFSTPTGFAYGDLNIRSDAQGGYGEVPMPGIIDAEIFTKSSEGSLREARVNFVCFNKRQLEILETLYMRPGYPILLEWGWVPFINLQDPNKPLSGDNPAIPNETGFSMLEEFFKDTSTLNSINNKILEQKIDSGGNYDGFVGFCKNFNFKAREDGGYDCSTEIIAHGEILESLKSTTKIASKINNYQDFQYEKVDVDGEEKRLNYTLDTEVETIDNFLYLLRSIKANLDKAGYKATMTYIGTTLQKDDGRDFSTWARNIDTGLKPPPDAEEEIYEILGRNERHSSFGIDQGVRFSYFEDLDGKVIPIYTLNQISLEYEIGINEIFELISDVTKTSIKDLKEELKNYDQTPYEIRKPGPSYLYNIRSGEYVGDMNKKNFYDEDGLEQQRITSSVPIEYATTVRQDFEGIGLQSLFQGTILREFSLEQEEETDSGIRKKIFVRWDLICQILNQKVIPEYSDKSSLVELTYLTKNTDTYRKGTTEKGGKFKGDGFYIPYSKTEGGAIIPFDSIGFNDNFFNDLVKYNSEEVEGSFYDGYRSKKPLRMKLGDALDTLNSTYIEEEKQGMISQFGRNSLIDLQKREIIFPPILGRSFDRDICLMPHQLPQMTVSNDSFITDGQINSKNFTSFDNVSAQANSIGHVYFNLDYLINQYEQLALEEHKTTDSLGDERTKKRLKKEFSIHDWITTIWNGVNDACAGFYDFDLHVEHERPHVARIIDFTMSGTSRDIDRPIFEFNPQGLFSITRENHFSSKLDNDFAATISIAAQAPNDLQSLESVSFKAFHKGIKNRFTSGEKDERATTINDALEKYRLDYTTYENTIRSLIAYVNRMNIGNYENELIGRGSDNQYISSPLSPDTAKSLAKNLLEQRTSLLSRYPEKDDQDNVYDGSDKVNGHYTGEYRDDLSEKGSPTFNRNPIIPLESSITMDGISGMNPLQIYKINSDKLPNGYRDPNMVFVVKSESHKITAGQDWTTSITGQISFLNDNPLGGKNPTIKIRSNKQVEADEYDRSSEDWLKYIEDWPWSGVFISYCVLKTVGKEKFDSSASHTSFFTKNGPKGKEQFKQYWEILDPKTTPLKLGDIILQGRKGNSHTFNTAGNYGGSGHSDIVTDINLLEQTVTLVGGNVSNAVRKKFIKVKTPTNSEGLSTLEVFLYENSYADGYGLNYTMGGGGVREAYTHGAILRIAPNEINIGAAIAYEANYEWEYWPRGTFDPDYGEGSGLYSYDANGPEIREEEGYSGTEKKIRKYIEYHYGENRGPNSLTKNIPYPPRDQDDYEYDNPGNPGGGPTQPPPQNPNINHNNILVPGYNPGGNFDDFNIS